MELKARPWFVKFLKGGFVIMLVLVCLWLLFTDWEITKFIALVVLKSAILVVIGAFVLGIAVLTVWLVVISPALFFTGWPRPAGKWFLIVFILLTVAFAAVEIPAHFFMSHELSAVEGRFQASCSYDDEFEDVVYDGSALNDREQILGNHGFSYIGRWWCRCEYTFSCSSTTEGFFLYTFVKLF